VDRWAATKLCGVDTRVNSASHFCLAGRPERLAQQQISDEGAAAMARAASVPSLNGVIRRFVQNCTLSQAGAVSGRDA
jgi:hypothetical protein